MQTEYLTHMALQTLILKFSLDQTLRTGLKWLHLQTILLLKVVSEIHDPVTTTDELIPSGETSSYRSNPLGLAEFALSRKDPEYVGKAKEVQKVEKAREEGKCMCDYSDEYKASHGNNQGTVP